MEWVRGSSVQDLWEVFPLNPKRLSSPMGLHRVTAMSHKSGSRSLGFWLHFLPGTTGPSPHSPNHVLSHLAVNGTEAGLFQRCKPSFPSRSYLAACSDSELTYPACTLLRAVSSCWWFCVSAQYAPYLPLHQPCVNLIHACIFSMNGLNIRNCSELFINST